MRSQGRFRFAPIFIVLVTALTATVAASANQTRSSEAPGVANARADLVKIQAGINEWTGPATGPKAESGKTIVFVTHDLGAPVEAGIAKSLTAVAKKVGWKVKAIDGQNSMTEMASGLYQAIA